MTKNFPLEGDVRTLTDYFGEIVPPCVEVCILLNRKDILFEQVKFVPRHLVKKHFADPFFW